MTRSAEKQNPLAEIIDFLREAEKLKLIERIPYLSNQIRRENDAEHSWYMSLILLVLENRLNLSFDVLKVHQMIIIHDLVEIYTDDDWVTDDKGKQAKRIAEANSAEKLFSLLPADLELKFSSLWREYEAGTSIESKIAKGIDKISYTLQYSISKKIEWHKPYVTREVSRNYALPYLKDNETLSNMLDLLLDELDETIKENMLRNNN